MAIISKQTALLSRFPFTISAFPRVPQTGTTLLKEVYKDHPALKKPEFRPDLVKAYLSKKGLTEQQQEAVIQTILKNAETSGKVGIIARGWIAVDLIHHLKNYFNLDCVVFHEADDAEGLPILVAQDHIQIDGKYTDMGIIEQQRIDYNKEKAPKDQITLMHPGIGFLSESPVAARLFNNFLASSAEAQEACGDKYLFKVITSQIDAEQAADAQQTSKIETIPFVCIASGQEFNDTAETPYIDPIHIQQLQNFTIYGKTFQLLQHDSEVGYYISGPDGQKNTTFSRDDFFQYVFETLSQEFPEINLMAKATAGGGGSGNHKYQGVTADGITQAVQDYKTLRARGETNWQDDRVMLEGLIQNGKHIELNFVIDKHGNIILYSPRECSCQIKMQKFAERSDNRYITKENAPQFVRYIQNLLQKTGYVGNAGTIEFMVEEVEEDIDGAPQTVKYFKPIEINPRLQVENNVSSLVDEQGNVVMIDALAAQLGYNLQTWNTAGVQCGVHAVITPPEHVHGQIYTEHSAVEASKVVEFIPGTNVALQSRICLQNPAKGFEQVDGQTLQALHIPKWVLEHPNIVIKSSYLSGEIPSYDPLLFIIQVVGTTERDARELIVQALKAIKPIGVISTIEFAIKFHEDERNWNENPVTTTDYAFGEETAHLRNTTSERNARYTEHHLSLVAKDATAHFASGKLPVAANASSLKNGGLRTTEPQLSLKDQARIQEIGAETKQNTLLPPSLVEAARKYPEANVPPQQIETALETEKTCLDQKNRQIDTAAQTLFTPLLKLQAEQKNIEAKLKELEKLAELKALLEDREAQAGEIQKRFKTIQSLEKAIAAIQENTATYPDKHVLNESLQENLTSQEPLKRQIVDHLTQIESLNQQIIQARRTLSEARAKIELYVVETTGHPLIMRTDLRDTHQAETATRLFMNHRLILAYMMGNLFSEVCSVAEIGGGATFQVDTLMDTLPFQNMRLMKEALETLRTQILTRSANCVAYTAVDLAIVEATSRCFQTDIDISRNFDANRDMDMLLTTCEAQRKAGLDTVPTICINEMPQSLLKQIRRQDNGRFELDLKAPADGTILSVTEFDADTDYPFHTVAYEIQLKDSETVIKVRLPLKGQVINHVAVGTEVAKNTVLAIIKGNDPYTPEKALEMVDRFVEAGYHRIDLKDAVGITSPDLVKATLELIRQKYPTQPKVGHEGEWKAVSIGLHFHNFANIHAQVNAMAAQYGCTWIDIGSTYYGEAVSQVGLPTYVAHLQTQEPEYWARLQQTGFAQKLEKAVEYETTVYRPYAEQVRKFGKPWDAQISELCGYDSVDEHRAAGAMGKNAISDLKQKVESLQLTDEDQVKLITLFKIAMKQAHFILGSEINIISVTPLAKTVGDLAMVLIMSLLSVPEENLATYCKDTHPEKLDIQKLIHAYQASLEVGGPLPHKNAWSTEKVLENYKEFPWPETSLQYFAGFMSTPITDIGLPAFVEDLLDSKNFKRFVKPVQPEDAEAQFQKEMEQQLKFQQQFNETEKALETALGYKPPREKVITAINHPTSTATALASPDTGNGQTLFRSVKSMIEGQMGNFTAPCVYRYAAEGRIRIVETPHHYVSSTQFMPNLEANQQVILVEPIDERGNPIGKQQWITAPATGPVVYEVRPGDILEKGAPVFFQNAVEQYHVSHSTVGQIDEAGKTAIFYQTTIEGEEVILHTQALDKDAKLLLRAGETGIKCDKTTIKCDGEIVECSIKSGDIIQEKQLLFKIKQGKFQLEIYATADMVGKKVLLNFANAGDKLTMGNLLMLFADAETLPPQGTPLSETPSDTEIFAHLSERFGQRNLFPVGSPATGKVMLCLEKDATFRKGDTIAVINGKPVESHFSGTVLYQRRAKGDEAKGKELLMVVERTDKARLEDLFPLKLKGKDGKPQLFGPSPVTEKDRFLDFYKTEEELSGILFGILSEPTHKKFAKLQTLTGFTMGEDVVDQRAHVQAFVTTLLAQNPFEESTFRAICYASNLDLMFIEEDSDVHAAEESAVTYTYKRQGVEETESTRFRVYVHKTTDGILTPLRKQIDAVNFIPEHVIVL